LIFPAADVSVEVKPQPFHGDSRAKHETLPKEAQVIRRLKVNADRGRVGPVLARLVPLGYQANFLLQLHDIQKDVYHRVNEADRCDVAGGFARRGWLVLAHEADWVAEVTVDEATRLGGVDRVSYDTIDVLVEGRQLSKAGFHESFQLLGELFNVFVETPLIHERKARGRIIPG